MQKIKSNNMAKLISNKEILNEYINMFDVQLYRWLEEVRLTGAEKRDLQNMIDELKSAYYKYTKIDEEVE